MFLFNLILKQHSGPKGQEQLPAALYSLHPPRLQQPIRLVDRFFIFQFGF